MSDEGTTRPTLETILERINALGSELRADIDALRTELRSFRIAVEDHLEQLETRMDRTQGTALEARADLRELRAVLRAQFKQPT